MQVSSFNCNLTIMKSNPGICLTTFVTSVAFATQSTNCDAYNTPNRHQLRVNNTAVDIEYTRILRGAISIKTLCYAFVHVVCILASVLQTEWFYIKQIKCPFSLINLVNKNSLNQCSLIGTCFMLLVRWFLTYHQYKRTVDFVFQPIKSKINIHIMTSYVRTAKSLAMFETFEKTKDGRFIFFN